ncbi:GDSL esterase/lipase At2g38180-like [Lycium ferocissimum]|uniref:GDSL esterase/lipase At2g38180-like n=1 Tax=Lycium ferocissimum TaxID=112874 RepID=UPI00281639BE|nr:GDSL esterase/lipase At2g38180-like [Lycium ferocissimum]
MHGSGISWRILQKKLCLPQWNLISEISEISEISNIVLRGYGGWNTRLALQVLDQIFPKDAAVQPSLVIVYFGGNDSVRPDPNGISTSHVPLSEYVQNMKKIILHLKSLSEKTRIIILSTPAVNEEQIIKVYG